MAPGLRVGYCLAPAFLQSWLVTAKQGNDLHTSTFSQALAAEYLHGGHLARHLPAIIARYASRQSSMLQALHRYMPAGYTWCEPQGGMFVWLQGPAGLDTVSLYPRAEEHNVAYVPGTFFFPVPGQGVATMRLNFTRHTETEITSAVRTLARLCTQAAPAERFAIVGTTG